MLKRVSRQIGTLCIIIAILISGAKNSPTVLAKGNTYTVKFLANGGIGKMALQKIKIGKKTALRKCTFTRKGYSFRGWAKSKKGTMVYRDKIKVKNLAKAGKTVKLYAVWQAEPVRRALILGETSTSQVPMADVTSMESMINACTFSGKKMSEVVLFSDKPKAAITKKIKSLFKSNKSTDISYIYFTCHGAPTGEIKIGSDGEEYTPAELRDLLDKNVKGKVVLLLDYCYSGIAVQGVPSSKKAADSSGTSETIEPSEIFLQSFVEDRNEDSDEKAGELAVAKYRILCSSYNTETSHGEKDVASYATKYWELGAGWDEEQNKKVSLMADINKDQQVTLDELYKYSYKMF
ncbi:MAG: InlB B-repeat-containing protein [Lachnospiraceae bacterium]|nr:InlB B-repeat-containing protein [Lachnospiraceae bacterium]